MSFLAQLRQQQPDVKDGLKLCYLLQINQSTQALSLSLSLAELDQGLYYRTGRPYTPKRQHLQQPPPYITRVDTIVLRQLINVSEGWLEGSYGCLSREEGEVFLRALIDTRRCFALSYDNVWVSVNYRPGHPVEPYWAINNQGGQYLRWRLTSGGSLACTASPLWVYELTNQFCDIGLGVSSLSEEALEVVDTTPQVLSTCAVNAFLRQSQAHWLAWGLPLPKPLPRRIVPARITPVLHCYTHSGSSACGEQDLLHLAFRYSGDHYSALTCLHSEAILEYWDGENVVSLERDAAQEQVFQEQLASFLSTLGFVSQGGKPLQWCPSLDSSWQRLLTLIRPQLESLGFVFLISAHFRHHYVIADDWQVHITNDKEGDFWQLSLSLSIEDTSFSATSLLTQLKQLNSQLSGGESLHLTLADGRLLLLPAEKITGIMADLGDLLEHMDRQQRLPRSQLHRLNSLHEQLPVSTLWQGDTELLERAISIHQTPVMLDSELCGVNAELRPYQWLGVCWLQHLKQHQANGLLADDMGLGKTLQTLSHLSLEFHQGMLKAPALIVAPTSLLHNWVDEIERFVPHLRYQLIHGPQRHQYWAQLDDCHLVISSYQSVANDLSYWQQQKLSWLILDEAQVIKNPRTQLSKAIREIESDYRLCLSGTPMGNHLGELWSLMDFLMPSCLGSQAEFKQYYQKPIEQDANSDKLQQLLKRIAPFMLRRNKDQVARDLPAKTEVYQHITLNDDQRLFYEHIKSVGWMDLQTQINDVDNKGQQQILVLTALLKLRQACCDPQLLGEESVSSAKREYCIDMLEELVSEGRAILVFSQFTGMLDLLAKDLQVRDIDYLLLSGKTRDRRVLVESFQKGKAPVFLISLKAGGVGLNLTRADTVIHYDPWWNDAAQQQATDRAHRIGQNNPVFVYKLIAENTIEEKIASLQQRKAVLSQHIHHQAELSGKELAMTVEELLELWQEESI